MGEFKPSVLGGYERCECTISLERFTDLAKLFGVHADRLLGGVLGTVQGQAEVVFDLNRLALLDEQEVRAVAEFAHNVRTKRGDYFTDVISLRSGDVEALAFSDGLAAKELLSKLQPALRGEPRGASDQEDPQGR